MALVKVILGVKEGTNSFGSVSSPKFHLNFSAFVIKYSSKDFFPFSLQRQGNHTRMLLSIASFNGSLIQLEKKFNFVNLLWRLKLN